MLHLQPIGICFNSDTEFSTLQMLNPLDYSPIRRYTISSDEVDNFQNLLLTQSFDNIVVGALSFLVGEIYNTKNGGLIYVPNFMNHFVSFNNNRVIKYSRNTIDEINLPSVQRERFDIVSFRFPKEQLSAYYSTLSDNGLYIVSYKASKKTDDGMEYVFDAYSIENGDYLYSFKLLLNEKMINVHISKDKIYVLKQNTELSVLSYKIIE